MPQSKKQTQKEFWLFHPGLVNREKGFTGRYRPGGTAPDGTPMIEMEQILNKNDVSIFTYNHAQQKD